MFERRRQRVRFLSGVTDRVDLVKLLNAFGPEICDAEGIVFRLGSYLPAKFTSATTGTLESPPAADWLCLLSAVCERAEFTLSLIELSQSAELNVGVRTVRLTRDEERLWLDSRYSLQDVLDVRNAAVKTDRTFHESPFPREIKALSVVETRRALSQILQWVECRLSANQEPVTPSKSAEKRVPESDHYQPIREAASRKTQTFQWLANAMLQVQAHPDWTDARIALEVGKHKSTLSRNKTYQMAAAAARAPTSDFTGGFETVNESRSGRRRDVEAIDDSFSPARDSEPF